MKLRIKTLVSKERQNEEQQKLDVNIDIQIENETETESEGESRSENDEVIFIRKIPTHPRNCLKRQVWNFFQMAKRNIDILSKNYGAMYGIDAEDKTLRYLVERHHGQTQYFIFRGICELAVKN